LTECQFVAALQSIVPNNIIDLFLIVSSRRDFEPDLHFVIVAICDGYILVSFSS